MIKLATALLGNLTEKQIRQEASRLASMANKRLQRLEKAGLKSSPAYKKWAEEGGERFGIRGKNFNQVQSELARLRKFVDAQTSTIKGTNKVLREMATNTGIKFNNISELHSKAENFFELASKVEQYLRTVEDAASAIGYQKIWEAINTYVKDTGTDLANTEMDVENLAGLLSNVLLDDEENREQSIDSDMWTTIR